MNYIKFILSTLLVFSFSANAGRILKTKKNKALITLEKDKAKRGDHFEVLDHYGHLRGIIYITRTHKKKAIGVLIAGAMKPKWVLEATTNKQVLKLKSVLKANTKPTRNVASIKRAKKKALNKKLKVLKKYKRTLNRKIASIEKALNKTKKRKKEIYVVENDSFFNESQAQITQQTSSPIETETALPEETSNVSPRMSSTRAGILFKPNYKIQKIVSSSDKITLSGLSYVEPRLFMEGIYKSKVSAQFNLGYSEFGIQEQRRSCEDSHCRFVVGNAVLGFEFKASLWQAKSLQVKTGLQGNLFWPIRKASNIIVEDKIGIYGDLGVVAGADFLVGKSFVIPFYANANLVIPPTQKIMFYSFGLTTGLGWRF